MMKGNTLYMVEKRLSTDLQGQTQPKEHFLELNGPQVGKSFGITKVVFPAHVW